MDQIMQLQRQIQDLRQEVNAISQVASQLQRSEANNAAQLQRLTQSEAFATQQLQQIQQLCNRLSQDVNTISNVAQQITAQVTNRMTTGQFGPGAWTQPVTGQFGANVPGITTGMYGPAQFGTYGAQFGGRADEFQRNQYISQLAANRYGAGFNAPDYATNQYISSLANQGALGTQPNFGPTTFAAGAFGTGISPTGYAGVSTGNFRVEPAHPVQTGQQFGASGFAGAQYIPAYTAGQMGTTGQWATASQPGTGLFGAQTAFGTGAQNIGRYSNF